MALFPMVTGGGSYNNFVSITTTGATTPPTCFIQEFDNGSVEVYVQQQPNVSYTGTLINVSTNIITFKRNCTVFTHGGSGVNYNANATMNWVGGYSYVVIPR